MNLIKRILPILIHISIIGIIFVSWLPKAKYFYFRDLPLGNDTLNFMYYTQEFRNNLSFPVSAWKYQAFEGMPRLVDTSWLHFYFIQPLVSWIGIMPATKIYPLIALFLFLVFSYFLFFELSSNYLLSGSLALILAKTENIYIPLFSSGVVLSSISQTFFPLTFYFLVRFFKRNEDKSFYLAAASLALAIFTHPGAGVITAFLCTGIFFAFIKTETIGFFNIAKKFQLAFKFFVISVMIASIAILPNVYTKIFEGGHQWLTPVLTAQTNVFSFLYSTLNPAFFIIIAISLVIGILFIKNINEFILPFIGCLIYFFVFIGSIYLGKNPLSGFIFPHRIFWMFTVSILALAAVLAAPQGFLEFGKIKKWILIILSCILIPTVSLIGLTSPLNQIPNLMPEENLSTLKYKNLTSDPVEIWSKPFLALTDTELSFF